jgi:hypothetical protein
MPDARLTMAEMAVRVLGRWCLTRGIGSLVELKQEVAAWQAPAVSISRRFTTADARGKLKRLYSSIPDCQTGRDLIFSPSHGTS